ncbi:MAG: hypothetical protein DMF77_19170 [Acidobacteria bacterium]|nr:MAG: hypothetical protein DMF77_19170 [Acidobacteriota bacterium]
MAEEPNYLAHAFKSQYNLIGLGTALGFAVLSGTLLPIIVAAGIEMVVLPLVSGSGRFQRLVRARTSEEADEQTAARRRLEASEMLQYMPEAERSRYRALQALTNEIRQNYKGMDSSSQMLLEQLVEKLDFLLSFYLRMRYSLTRYHNYFSSTDPERIQERVAMLEHEMKSGPERVQQIKARTRSVLQKRLDRYKKALENRDLIDAQTETVQEVLQLLRDQSYSLRDPRSITEQIDGLVSSAEETERGVKDMEEILAVENEMLSSGGLDADIEAELQASRAGSSAATSSPAPVRARVPPPPGSPPPPPRKKVTH